MAIYYDAEGNEVEVSEPKDLRDQLSKKSKEAQELQERLATLEAEVRKGKIESTLANFDPKVRALVEEFNLDPSVVVDKYGDLFGATAPQAPAETTAQGEVEDPQAQGWAQLQAAAAGAEPVTRDVSQAEADLAKLPDDPAQIAAYMRSLTATGGGA